MATLIYKKDKWLLYCSGVLQSMIGISAIAGGLRLVMNPAGTQDIPIDWLHGSPFSNYLIPGLVLAFVIGFGNVYAGFVSFLRHILHDWEDPEAIAILRNCREAVAPDAKIIVVEMVIPCGNEPSFGKWLDLMMLLVAGRERTEEEYGGLFSAAGLKLNRIIPTATEVSIIEGLLAR